MGIALAKLAKKTRPLRLIPTKTPDRTIIAGMGELHLEIIVDRLLREFKVEANVGKPQVSYKETITTTADVDHKYAKQSGGHGQYGHVKIKVYPREPVPVSNSSTPSSAVQFRRNSFRRSRRYQRSYGKRSYRRISGCRRSRRAV